MTLLNAPEFDSRREKRNHSILIGAAVVVVLAIVIGLGGYIMGHGWFFSLLPVEHRINVFMNTLQDKDYAKAYGIWMNDPNWEQHPQKYDYTLKRFTEDWTTASAEMLNSQFAQQTGQRAKDDAAMLLTGEWPV